jgi:DNA-binding PadR family transcriptional regulator
MQRALQLGSAHGHAVARAIEPNSDGRLRLEPCSLYPALHRIIKRGWIDSEPGVSENNRLAANGRKQLLVEASGWDNRDTAIAGILSAAAKDGRR